MPAATHVARGMVSPISARGPVGVVSGVVRDADRRKSATPGPALTDRNRPLAHVGIVHMPSAFPR